MRAESGSSEEQASRRSVLSLFAAGALRVDSHGGVPRGGRRGSRPLARAPPVVRGCSCFGLVSYSTPASPGAALVAAQPAFAINALNTAQNSYGGLSRNTGQAVRWTHACGGL